MSIRRFDPALCCDHDWEHVERIATDEGEPFVCLNDYCNATCARDDGGKIVDYDSGVELYDTGAITEGLNQ
jgi:hypothetical protein